MKAMYPGLAESVDLIHPALMVEETCMTDPVAPGGTAEFEVTATNTGDFARSTDGFC